MKLKEALASSIKGGFSTKELLRSLGIRESYDVNIGTKYMAVTTHVGNTKQLCSFEKLLLMKEFWECLAKNELWGDDETDSYIVIDGEATTITIEWKLRFYYFMTQIADGKTIERAFELSTKQ